MGRGNRGGEEGARGGRRKGKDVWGERGRGGGRGEDRGRERENLRLERGEEVGSVTHGAFLLYLCCWDGSCKYHLH